MLLCQLAAGRGPTGWLGTSWWGCVPDWSLRGRSWHGWRVLLLPEPPREPINNEAHDWCLSLLLTTSGSTCLTNSPNLGHTFQPSPIQWQSEAIVNLISGRFFQMYFFGYLYIASWQIHNCLTVSVYRAGLKSGPQVARMFQASWGRGGKQQK